MRNAEFGNGGVSVNVGMCHNVSHLFFIFSAKCAYSWCGRLAVFARRLRKHAIAAFGRLTPRIFGNRACGPDLGLAGLPAQTANLERVAGEASLIRTKMPVKPLSSGFCRLSPVSPRGGGGGRFAGRSWTVRCLSCQGWPGKRRSIFWRTWSSILMRGGQPRWQPSPGSLWVASMPSLLPAA